MDETSEHPIEDMVRDANLEFVSDGYDDYIVREMGKDVTEEADEQYEHFAEAMNGTIQMALRKIEEQEPDVNFRVGLALNGWRPSKEQMNKIWNFSLYLKFYGMLKTLF